MFDFKQIEEQILQFWDEHDIFQKSIDQRKGEKPFVFFEGPPTANGHPHVGHFEGRVFKDLFSRYQAMRGHFVLRKAGWDTHGLPVELEVEKALGFKSKKDIEAYGVAAYNRACKESVWKYKSEWEAMTRRMGFWVDLEHPYVTYENVYMESLWNIIAQFHERNLLYQAHRVVPFCTRCGTPLSSHEVAQGYKTVTDTSVYLKFKIKSKKLATANWQLPKDTSILVWTTTPWTLPGNVALAVGENIQYVLVKKFDEYFILAKDLAEKVLEQPFEIEREFTGNDLVGTSYEPLFAVKSLKNAKSYKVYAGDFVTTTDGTGIVHIAPMYGEDDYRLGMQQGLPAEHTVNEQGNFVDVSKELNGRYVKDAETEKLIFEKLETGNFLLKTFPYEHEYPFCWRCDTPLLYYAKDSWFVRMSELNRQLLANNETINWVPSHLKEGRFGQWLREGKDWAFSRERYWGTPLPIWRSKDKKETFVVSSLADLDTYRATKPATFWMVRHGEAQKNADHVINGGLTPSPLTETGRAQVAATAEMLKSTPFAAIITSPLQRAHETAHIIAHELGIKKIIVDERLREIQLGPSLDGKLDTNYDAQFPTYEDRFTQQPPGGESLADLRARVWSVLKELNEEYAGKQVLLVSHEYPIWMMADVANGWTMAQSIAEKEKRGDDFLPTAGAEQIIVRNLPRNERGELDMHRPYIDDIVLKKDGKLLHRVPEIADVWFDSGSMPYAQWHWPFENEELFQQQFPADFICEGIDQTRGWFYTLLAVATALGYSAPYRTVLSLGHVLDEKGQKLSKSKGNYISPNDIMDAVGVDATRWYFYTVNNPGDPKLFSMKEVRERLTGFMGTLQNCVKFWELYSDRPEARNFSHGDPKPSNLLDQWVLSRLHRLIATTTKQLDTYDPTGAARAIEQFIVDDLSQWWLRRSRKRPESLGLLRHVLLELDKLIAPFIPFTAEDIHQRLHVGSKPGTESVHLHDWPAASQTCINDQLEQQMARTREFISAGLAIRKDQGIRVRQPLMSATGPAAPTDSDLINLVKDELNIKEVFNGPTGSSEPVALNTNITRELRAEGFAREVMRMIQDMRKEAGCNVSDVVTCQWSTTDSEIKTALDTHRAMIIRDTGLSAFSEQADHSTLTIEKTVELTPGISLWIGIQK